VPARAIRENKRKEDSGKGDGMPRVAFASGRRCWLWAFMLATWAWGAIAQAQTVVSPTIAQVFNQGAVFAVAVQADGGFGLAQSPAAVASAFASA